MKNSLLLAGLMICFFISAKETIKKARVNEDYIKYQQMVESGNLIKYTKDGKSLGFRPSPLYIPPRPENIRLDDKEDFFKGAAIIPEKYDLRDKGILTSVKDQGPIGACWTFGAIGAIESTWKLLGKNEFDLSEENMARCHGFEWGYDEGGNFEIATAYLNTLIGPVTESDDPYDPNNLGKLCTYHDAAAYSVEARWPIYNEKNLKRAIMEYGGIAVSIKMGNYELYYNSNDHTYYYGGEDNADHGVILVGWDDTKVVTGGTASPEGTHVGAWIIKNSWGDNWGDNGYAYVSYKDLQIAAYSAVFPSFSSADEIKHYYSHDDYGVITSVYTGDNLAYGLVKYEAKSKQFINKIGTYIVAEATTIDIEIYDDKNGDELQNLLAERKGIECSFAGYYTFDINALVEDDFYVLVKYRCPYYSYLVPVEAYYQNYALAFITPKGACWLSSDGDTWTEIGNNFENLEFDICIRAYGVDANDPQAFFNVDKDIVCTGSTVTFTDQSVGTGISTYEWDFGEGASPATASTQGPHQVTYSTAGRKTVSLIVTGTSGNNTYTSSECINVTDDIFVHIPYSVLISGIGKTLTVNAFGADTYTWSPSTGLNTNEGSEVIATITEDSIVYTVTGQQGSCTDEASVKIYGFDNPNDDVCEAIEVELGINGPYTNLFATVESGEPFPPLTGCNVQMGWCDEYQYTDATRNDPLDNTIWFYFEGPAGGKASFNSISYYDQPKSCDNAIAVYKAETCEDILSDNYELIAANDDYYDDDNSTEDYFNLYAAAIELKDGFVAGDRYWIQVDGSGGGTEFLFYLEILETDLNEYTEPITDINENIFNENDLFSLYPNPSNGIFNLSYNGQKSTSIIVDVFDVSGKRIYIKDFNNINGGFNTSISLENISKGMYFIKVTSENTNHSSIKKLMIE